MGRGKSRPGYNRNHHFHENRTYKPINNLSQQQQQQQLLSDVESSSSLPSTSSQQQPSFRPKTRRNPKWVLSNYAPKQRFMDNSDVGSRNSEELSCSNLNTEVAASSSEVSYEIENKEKSDQDSYMKVSDDLNDGYGTEDGVDGVMSVFQKLQLGVEEPDLYDEQVKINDQLQEDELLALESIYDENVFVLDKQGGLRSFQIHIHVETSGGLTVTTKLNSSGGLEMRSENDFTYSFEVQYLPPIVLTCLLPKSYPSHLPPYFTISVQWLDSIRLSNLCSMLDEIWMKQPGQEVVYQWVEWLQTSSLSYLGADQEIKLSPYGIKHSEDRRAVSGSVSPDVDFPLLRSYNDGKDHENFLQTMHECYICYDEYIGSNFIRLPCQHYFCCTCMKKYLDIRITEGTVNKLQCPDTNCRGIVPPGLLKRLLGDEEYERWESLMLQKTLDSMSDVAYCPRCETPCVEDEAHDAQCSKCLFSFCTLCRGRRHVGEECLTPEIRLRILEERQNSSQLQDKQKLREREMINELLSLKEIRRDAKQCPSCKMAISKTEGCNKMVCNNCGQYFCYKCNKAIDGYDHYRNGACELFPQYEIERWERRMNPRQELAQVQAELFVRRAQSCPNCGQFNAKMDNNNHIFCWACQKHHCYLCRKIVNRGDRHFGPKGCKQHTSD